jgi:hypothetical protein
MLRGEKLLLNHRSRPQRHRCTPQAAQSATMALEGYQRRVAACNTPAAARPKLLPLLVAGQTVGFLLSSFGERLCQTSGGTVFQLTDSSVQLSSDLATAEARTEAVGRCLRTLHRAGVISGWRDELLPVAVDFDSATLFLVERAAAPFLGIKAFGVHVNCFVRTPSGLELWVGRRSRQKQTWPGMLDHMVAGGQPHGISPHANVVKEAKEEGTSTYALRTSHTIYFVVF